MERESLKDTLMNREIKFRAWDKEMKEMFYNVQNSSHSLGDTDTDWKGHYRDYHGFDGVLEDVNLVLMQYTGLKDKNGKEIYEMDILKDKWGQESKMEYGEFYDSGIYVSGFGVSVCPKNSEVIGNIYSNPELIE